MKIITIILLSLSMGLALSTTVFANTSMGLTKALSQCVDIDNDGERLACFDLLASKNIASLNQPVIVEAIKETLVIKDEIQQEEAKKIDNFSKESLKKSDEDNGPDRITAKISKLTKLIRGEWVIYFENGQKWQQTDTTKFKLSVGDIVRLEKGTFSAVYLHREGTNRNIRVKRLK